MGVGPLQIVLVVSLRTSRYSATQSWTSSARCIRISCGARLAMCKALQRPLVIQPEDGARRSGSAGHRAFSAHFCGDACATCVRRQAPPSLPGSPPPVLGQPHQLATVEQLVCASSSPSTLPLQGHSCQMALRSWPITPKGRSNSDQVSSALVKPGARLATTGQILG